MNNSYIDKLAFVHVLEKSVLSTRSRGKDTWYIPGGKREAGETDIEALVREVKEELSVDIIPTSIRKYGVFEAEAHGKPAGTIVRMTCYTADFDGELAAASEIEEVAFLKHADKDKSSAVDKLIFDDLKSRKLLD